MYLYLGGDSSVLQKNIIGIFDIDEVTVQKSSRDFLRAAQNAGRVHDAGGGRDLPKSFVLTEKGVLLSSVNSITLQKRADA